MLPFAICDESEMALPVPVGHLRTCLECIFAIVDPVEDEPAARNRRHV